MSAWDRRPDALSPGWDLSLPPRVPSGRPAPLGSLDGPGQDFTGSQHSAVPQGSCLSSTANLPESNTSNQFPQGRGEGAGADLEQGGEIKAAWVSLGFINVPAVTSEVSAPSPPLWASCSASRIGREAGNESPSTPFLGSLHGVTCWPPGK